MTPNTWHERGMAELGARFDRDYDRLANTVLPYPYATDRSVCGLFSIKDCPLEWCPAISQENEYEQN